MAKAAGEIYSKHLCAGACEPVNVDSHARRVAEEGLNFPTPSIFLPAQKQIFNLMKFDCYQRFLKSSIFKDSVICEMQGQPLPYEKCVFSGADVQKQDQKLICEERKRRSLFPWNKLSKTKANRLKVCSVQTGSSYSGHNKCRKPKNKVQDFHICDTSSTQSDGASSRSSFTDSDPGTEIRNMQQQEVNSNMKPLEHEMSFIELNCERVFLFSIELPNKKMISVKAKGGKTCEDILKPVLHKYGYKMEQVALQMASSQKPILLASPISFIDNKHIIVLLKELKNECVKMSDLETLTNQIFEDLMKKQPAFSGDLSSVGFQNFRRNDSNSEKP